MIPYLENGQTNADLPLLQDLYKDEVFISHEQLAESLQQRQISAAHATELWDTLMLNAGVHFAENGKVEYMTSGKLYCVRTLGPLPLVSVDGLVHDLGANKELYREGRNIDLLKLAEIAYIGYQFTPNREKQISDSLAIIISQEPEMQSHIDKLIA